jgi:hypothetical protein
VGRNGVQQESGSVAGGADVTGAFFGEVLEEGRELEPLSDELHGGRDAAGSVGELKSFKQVDGELRPPDDPGNPTVNFHGAERSNQTHCSTTHADALLARKGAGKEAKLSYSGHVLVENRNGLVMDTDVLQATGTAERDAGLLMAEAIPGGQRVTLGADKNLRHQRFHWGTEEHGCGAAGRLTAAPHATPDIKVATGSTSV